MCVCLQLMYVCAHTHLVYVLLAPCSAQHDGHWVRLDRSHPVGISCTPQHPFTYQQRFDVGGQARSLATTTYTHEGRLRVNHVSTPGRVIRFCLVLSTPAQFLPSLFVASYATRKHVIPACLLLQVPATVLACARKHSHAPQTVGRRLYMLTAAALAHIGQLHAHDSLTPCFFQVLLPPTQ